LVLASNFCRFESPKGNQELFQKAYAALKPDGSLVANDFLPNEERTGPTFALRFSVYTLTPTRPKASAGRYRSIPIGLKPQASTLLKLTAIYPRLCRELL